MERRIIKKEVIRTVSVPREIDEWLRGKQFHNIVKSLYQNIQAGRIILNEDYSLSVPRPMRLEGLNRIARARNVDPQVILDEMVSKYIWF